MKKELIKKASQSPKNRKIDASGSSEILNVIEDKKSHKPKMTKSLEIITSLRNPSNYLINPQSRTDDSLTMKNENDYSTLLPRVKYTYFIIIILLLGQNFNFLNSIWN